MIFFVHVPKTAGTSFRVAAERLFEGRVLHDYGRRTPATSKEIVEHVYDRNDREALARVATERNIGMICGHVEYQKYADLVTPERVVVFLREPVQRVLSEYHHHRRLYGYQGTLAEFAQRPVQRNKQARMVKGLNLDQAALVGLSEYYGDSLRLLAKRTGLELSYLELNANPEKHRASSYALPDEQAAELRELNVDDVLLYREVAEAFSRATGVSAAG